MIQNLDNVRAVELANLQEWGLVYVIVNGAAIVRLGDNPQQLFQQPTDGIPLTAATPAQQSFVWWKGRLWGIANAVTVVSIIIPAQGAMSPFIRSGVSGSKSA